MHMVKRSSEGARSGFYGCLPGRGAPGRLKCLGRSTSGTCGHWGQLLCPSPGTPDVGDWVWHTCCLSCHPHPHPVSILTPFVLVEAVRGTQVPSICGQLSVVVS